MRQSKKCSASGISRTSASTPCTRRKRRISSWNASGRPSASSATTSPSRMKGSPDRSRRAISTTSGRLRVTSDRRRVHTWTRSPARCSWMRAPSYLYSSAVRPPCAASTAGKSSAISASIGSSGTKGRGLAPATAAAPPAAASVATAVRSPRKSAGRRAAATSTPPPAAIASSSSPSDTPVRISPPMIRARNSRSSADTRAASRARRSSRARRAPAPVAAATSAKASAMSMRVGGSIRVGGPEMAPHTPPRSSRPGEPGPRLDSPHTPPRSSPPGEPGSRLDSASRSSGPRLDSLGKPRTPRTRGSEAGKARPARKATALAISSGAKALRNRATSSRFSSRPRARSSRRPRAAKSAKRVIPCILGRMRRLLLHDTDPAVTAAAAALGGTYEVRPLGTAAPSDAVILVTPRSAAAAADNVRLLGLVATADAGPWPQTWHAVLPLAAPAAMLAHAVAAAFADLDAAAERARLARDLSELNAIGIRLSAESNPRFLLEAILSKAREITSSDAGSLYIVEERGEAPFLRFALAQNDSVAVPFRTATLPLTDESIAGHVALTGRLINLADAYAPPRDSLFTINSWFDEQTGYRTKSMLVVPMRTPHGQTIGVLPLMNCKHASSARRADPPDVERHVRPYDARDEKLAGSLASQAAVAIYNRRLYLSIRDLFEGFVKASVTAIEARDPPTSGHSFRVADLTVALAETADRCESGPYRELKFRDDELMELRYASLLHDFGKVGVREHVLVKAKKLYPADFDRIRHRVELLKRDLVLRTARAKLGRAP